MYPCFKRVSKPWFQGIFISSFYIDDKSALRPNFATNVNHFAPDSKNNISPSDSENHSSFSDYIKKTLYSNETRRLNENKNRVFGYRGAK